MQYALSQTFIFSHKYISAYGLWLVIGLLRINLSTNDKPGIFAA
jgi:hypothetical protein